MKKKKVKVKDPFADREAQKYESPIPSREYILQFLLDSGRPMRRDEIFQALNLSTDEHKEALRRRLRAMERERQLIFNKRSGYFVPEKMDLVRGRVIGHKDGYGFLVDDEGGDDLFLNGSQMRAVFHGDRVLAQVSGIDRKGRREAVIVEVIEHAVKNLVGRYFEDGGIGYVVPDHKHITQDVMVPLAEKGKAKTGDIVSIEITEPPTFHKQAVGKVIEVLGKKFAAGLETEIAIRNYNIPHEWDENVMQELQQIPDEVQEKDKLNRLDLRHLPFVTIDGDDARDFDDAVYCKKKLTGGWQLYVAIADVSHYVKEQSVLDQDAADRGTSVYFPSRVVPMLPEKLSNNLCSLNPEVDRLCMVCEIVVSRVGEIVKYKFHEAVMHSQARLTYTQVSQWLETPSLVLNEKNKKVLPHLKQLHALFQVLLKARKERGAIDFETTETRIIFDDQRKIQKIVPTVRTVAHRIIEECMLLANVAAARFAKKNKLPILYRIHAGPTEEKLTDLRDFLKEFSLHLGGGKEPKPNDYANLITQIADRPEAHLLQTVLLRSLSQAVYSPDNIGHFGLAYPEYTHFTSPIRRYPDLLLHRGIRNILQNQKRDTAEFSHNNLHAIGEHSSMMERRADEATREVMDWLKCEYIQDHVGSEFKGLITGVTAFGFFVELQDIYVEGLVHVTALKDDYYHFDPKRRYLRGERIGIIYRLGDKVIVKVIKVDLDAKQIDFELVKAQARPGKKTQKRKKS